LTGANGFPLAEPIEIVLGEPEIELPLPEQDQRVERAFEPVQERLRRYRVELEERQRQRLLERRRRFEEAQRMELEERRRELERRRKRLALERAQRRARLRLAVGVGLSAVAVAAGLVLSVDPVSRFASGADDSAQPSGDANRQGNVYAATMSGELSAAVADVPERVYVPNNTDGDVVVIDPTTYEIIGRFETGVVPQHVTPSWDMKSLYAGNIVSDTLTEIDPQTGEPSRTIPVTDPYNLYFTPDGRRAIVVAERYQRLDFRDPESWKLIKSVKACPGVDHLDFSADGSYLIASCEFSGMIMRVNVQEMKLTGLLATGGQPIDVRVSPDGRRFFVANQSRNGVSVIDPASLQERDFIPTGAGAHGLQISRDTRSLYVSNRLDGSISVIDLKRLRVRDTWRVGGSPDMLQLSPNGEELWVSNRFHRTISIIDTDGGELIKQVTVGTQPHGLAYFPAPGNHSIGHNGVYR
jgi:YVTN family beta-propeller protein